MKTTIITIMTTCLALGASAIGTQTSSIIFDTYDNAAFNVSMANQEYYASPAATLQIDNVEPGLHWVKVYSQRMRPNGNGGMYRLLYQGNIRVPARSIVNANIGRHYRLDLAVSAMATQYSDCGYGCAIQQCPHVHDGHAHVDWVDDSPYTPYGNETLQLRPAAMDHRTFTQFRRSVQRMSFEREKLDAIRQQLAGVYMSASQVRILMSLFSFDSSRLKLARMAYPRVTNQDDFYIVTDAFTFSSTRRAFYEHG